ncbi:MAG: HNH endonuclease [Actinomycetota bacterium]|nr:HNH endonuclease [Actinomycetota bacterium]
MFDAATCTTVGDRWDAWAADADLNAGAYGDLSDPPGPDLAGALAMWDPASRSDEDLIDRIGGWEKITAWAHAGQLADIAELTHRRRQTDQLHRAAHTARGGHGEPGQLMEFVVDEIALAARISRVAANNRLDLAQDLTRVLPAVFELLQAGTIDLIRARIITDGTRTLDRAVRAAVADRVLTKAAAQTPSALRSAVARAVHILDPAGIEDRHTADLTRRRVTLTPVENGMSQLWALLPADGAAAIMATLHRLAEGSHTPGDRANGDRRTADQRRADALIDLATSYLDAHPALRPAKPAAGGGGSADPDRPTRSTAPPTRRPPAWAQVQVVLPANLLTGRGPEPAELIGYGPIPTSMAYRMAADASWQRLLTDPVTGALTDVGRTRYTPPAALAEFGITRDRRCRFPGCRQPRIDLDHHISYPAGPTADYNLAGLCRHHHRLKQHPRWQASLDRNTQMTWTTPTGHTHTTDPPQPVEPADPPPF